MTLKASMWKWWQRKGKDAFPGVNRLSRKTLLDLKNVLLTVDRVADDAWLKNNGLRTDFREAAKNSKTPARLINQTLSKDTIAKTMAKTAKTGKAQRVLGKPTLKKGI